MLLAELDANGWAFIIGAIGVVLMQLYNRHLAHQDDVARIEREFELAEASNDRAKLTREAVVGVSDAVKLVADGVKTIEIHTNSMTEKLGAETDEAGHARGVMEERTRADKVADDKLLGAASAAVAVEKAATKEEPCP